MSKIINSKIIVVCGPTATGKSDKAVEIALAKNGEIISADSRQVYKGLDIGSGKITAQEMQGVPHYLLDVADPKSKFSLADFLRLGEEAIQEVLQKNKLPIICGGTGYYIDALVNGKVLPEIEPNFELRVGLEKKEVSELFQILKKLDPKRAETIDSKNKIRLIRAIEIANELGHVPEIKSIKKYEVEYIYLDFPDEILKERIYTRLLKRLEIGMLEEAINLNRAGLSFERMKELGLEYKYMAMHLCGEISYQEMVELLKIKIWQYAKRQRTWFKKYAR
jgi:tRNA dimethylallyltransferase